MRASRAVLLGTLLAAPLPGAAQSPPIYQSRTIVRHTAPPADGVRCTVPASRPEAEGVDPAAVDSLVRLARAADSDALVLFKNGKQIGEWYFGRPREPIELMSLTKPVASLAIGRLLDEGRIASVEQPVASIFPEWRQGRKAGITLHHLLTHTSGLQNLRNAGIELEPAPDVVQTALAAELSADPGTHFDYNNKAFNLLAGVVERASGKPLDRYLGETVFRDLCITDFGWMHDPTGHPFTMSGAQMHAVDVARVGQMMLDGGSWGGRRVLGEAWVRRSVQVSQPLHPVMGLAWFLLPEWSRYSLDDALLAEWRARGVDEQFVRAVAPMAGTEYTREGFAARLDSIFGAGRGIPAWLGATGGKPVPGRRLRAGPIRGFYHTGSLGQYLVVIPETRVVAVRLVRRREGQTEAHSMPGFETRVMSLFGPRARPPAAPHPRGGRPQ